MSKALGEVDDWYNWHGLKYFLYEYEEHLAGVHGIKLSWPEILLLQTMVSAKTK